MSKIKYGFINHKEASEVFSKDKEALEKMKELEAQRKSDMTFIRLGRHEIASTKKIGESPMYNHIKNSFPCN